MQWPGDIRDALAAMLPRLEARADLRLVNAVALGTGSLKSADAKSLSKELVRAANGGLSAIRVSPEETKGMLSALGFGVHDE